MTIQTLINHYRTAKTMHETMSPSLAEKLTHIERVFGQLPITTTGLALVEAAKAAWPSVAPGTLKRYLVQLRAVLRRAERDGLIAKAPLIDVPYVHDVVYVDVTTSEIKMLLDYLQWTETRWYLLVLLLTHTGARLGEVLALNESSFTRHGVRVLKMVGRRTKTVERTIPYTPRMAKAVASGAFQGNSRIVPVGIGDASVPSCLGRVLDDATKALGLPTLRVHDLRHAFAAMLAESGADLADIATALGHSNTAMSMRYRGLVKSRLTGLMATI